MRTTETAAGELNASMISAILNLVCPQCGGCMMEFRCQGKCRKDWRSEWDSAVDAQQRTPRSRRHPSIAGRRA
jgi:radical SAM protein with 4Fe4S-binding SPASM domain